MTKRLLCAVAGLAALSISAFGQQTEAFTVRQGRPLDSAALSMNQDVLRTLDSAFFRSPTLTLANNAPFALADAFGWVQANAPDVLPPASSIANERMTSPAAAASGPSRTAVELQPGSRYVHGELGVLYGKSTGRFGRDLKSGYIISEMGDDKTQITVGVSYEESSGRVPRFGR